MGEALAKARAKGFDNQQDEAYAQELAARALFHERPEVYANEYPCVPLNTAVVVSDGDDVIVRRNTSSAQAAESKLVIEVVAGNQVVATVEGAGGVELLDVIASDDRCGGVISARVTGMSLIDGHFNVMCVNTTPDVDEK